MTDITQPSFAGGILSDSLFGRADLSRYANSAEELENFFTQAYGGFVKRGGSKYLANTKDNQLARLIPFSFNDEQTYILEFTNLLMRVYTLGGIVGLPFELATTYAEADLFNLNYVQSADVMTIVHPEYVPREVVRLSDTNWTITDISFGPSISAPTTNTLTPSAVSSHGYWYGVSAIDENTGEEGLIFEKEITNATQLDGTLSKYVNLNWDDVADAGRYNIYRRESTGSVYGYVGNSNESKFRDYFQNPDYLKGPQESGSSLTGVDDRPSAVAYYQQRLCFGGSNNNPQELRMSQTGNFSNFNISFPLRDDDAVKFTLDAEEVNRIKGFQGIRGGLLCLTSGDEFVITGGGGLGTPITPSSIFADSQTSRGANGVKPIRVGDSVLFIQGRGSYVRNFNFSIQSDGYTGDDLTIFANKLFRGFEITQWNYAQIKDSIIWAVRSDGKLLSLTYVPEQQVFSWCIHSTQGLFESVAVIAEGDEDAVYVSVKRKLGGTDYRFVERLQDSLPDDARDAFFVDAGLSYDVPQTITGITQANPGVVSITGHTLVDGDIVTIRDVVGMTEVNKKYYKVANKTANTFELTDQYSGANIDTTAFTEYVSGGVARDCVTTVSGLSHLPDGTAVSILADGNVVADKTVTSGSVTLPSAYGQVYVGLPYEAHFKGLPLAMLGGRTTRGKEKIVSSVVIQLLNSRGLLVGPNSSTLRPMKEREQEGWNEEIALQTGEPEINIDPDWNKKGSVYISCPDPLPARILSISPEIDVSD